MVLVKSTASSGLSSRKTASWLDVYSNGKSTASLTSSDKFSVERSFVGVGALREEANLWGHNTAGVHLTAQTAAAAGSIKAQRLEKDHQHQKIQPRGHISGL